MLTVQRLQRKMLQLLNSPNSLLAVLWISLFYFSFPLDPSTYLSDHFFSPTRTCPGFCPFTSRLQNAPFRAQQHHSLISSQRCDWAAWGPLSWLEKSPVQSTQHNQTSLSLKKQPRFLRCTSCTSACCFLSMLVRRWSDQNTDQESSFQQKTRFK